MAIFRGRGMLALFVAGSCGLVSAGCEVGSAADSEHEPPTKGRAAGTKVESTAAAAAAEDDAPPAIEEVPGVAVAQPSGLFDGTPFVQQPMDAPGDEYATHASLSMKGVFRPDLALEVRGLRAVVGGSK